MLRRWRGFAGVIVLLLIQAGAAWAQGANQSIRFDIPPAAAHRALNQFAQQANVQLLYPYDRVQGLRLKGLSGSFSVDEGIARLVAGTCLEVTFSSGANVVLSESKKNKGIWFMSTHTCKQPGVLSALTAAILAAFTTPIVHSQEKPRATIEEIIVTAQRREQNIQEVPIAITALSADALDKAGIDDTRSLEQVTPGLTFGTQGPFAQPTIRGIGTSSVELGDAANVAIYVDGVYNPMQSTGVFDLNSIERVEVLKGPQGTLFGRNATGGAIQVITRTPQQAPELKIKAGTGSFNLQDYDLYATSGVTDAVAVDLALSYLEDDGYVDNIYLNTDIADRRAFSARTKILFQPTDKIDLLLTLGTTDSDDNTVYATQPTKNGPVQRPNVANPALMVPGDTYEVVHNIIPAIESNSDQASLKATFDLGGVTLTSLTAWADQSTYFRTDGDGTPAEFSSFEFENEDETLQQEITLAGATGSTNWVVGAFYLDEDALRPYLDFRANGILFPQPATFADIKAWAVFGEVTQQFTDQFSMIFGLRYSNEERDSSTGADEWENVSPRISATYALNADTNVYATFSQGFKSGTFSNGVSIDPETVDALEVGIKSMPTDRITVNASAYYYDYQDIQVSAYVGSGSAITQLQNAASAEIKGFDVEMTALLTDQLTLRLGGAYTDATYDEFASAIVFTPRTVAAGGGNAQANADASGNTMIRTPEWTLNLGLDHTSQLLGGELLLTGNVFVSDGFYWDVGNYLDEPGYTLVNARASWTPAGSRLTFSLEGNNLTDEEYGIYVSQNTVGDRVAYGRPRTWGVSVEYLWN
jgi:iron complex outermembrane receptor protein